MKRNRTMTATARDLGAATLLACLAFAGCSDSPTAPTGGGAFDAQAARTSLDAMDNVLESPAWASYEAMSSRIGGSGIVASVVPALETGDGLPAVGQAASRLLSAASRIPLISPGSLGQTFVIDPATGEYAADPSRTGAPANGVRFILYDLIEGTEEPDLENEIGHVDLVDAGAGISGIDLRLTGVANGLTFIDYGVAVDGSDTEGTVSIDGFLTDGTDQLDFVFDVMASETGGQTTIDLDAMLSVSSHDLTVTLSADGAAFDGQPGSVTVQLVVQYGSESLAIDVTGSDTAIDASFHINGSLFATATGDPESPVILGADGMELSESEIAVLGEIVRTADEVFEFFEDLVEPAEGIILLAVIL